MVTGSAYAPQMSLTRCQSRAWDSKRAAVATAARSTSLLPISRSLAVLAGPCRSRRALKFRFQVSVNSKANEGGEGVNFVPRVSVPGVPNYAGGQGLTRRQKELGSTTTPPGPSAPRVQKAFWDIGIPDYSAPTAAIGAPEYGLFQYSADGGGGGSGKGGRGGGGGGRGGGGAGGGGAGAGSGGSAGSPMSGFTSIFALLIIVGGLIGYFKKGSFVSLLASFAFGATLLFCSSLMADPGNVLGVRLALVSVLVLGGYMGYKYYQNKKPHAGAIAVLCGLMGLGYIFNA